MSASLAFTSRKYSSALPNCEGKTRCGLVGIKTDAKITEDDVGLIYLDLAKVF